MSARILDGKALAGRLLARHRARAEALVRRAGVQPCLAVVLVGENPASRVYVRNKVAACAQAGIRSRLIELPEAAPEPALLAAIDALNADPAVHGILVQLPLPAQLRPAAVLERISAAKDVDGFHVRNVGALVTGNPFLQPCTPLGIMTLLAEEGIAVEGRHAVVIGRSNIVGKPVALMLLQAGATVSIGHSRTRDLGALTRLADILVAAAGVPRLIGPEMVSPGAAVIDVGINRLPDGRLGGDVDFEGVRAVAGAITPVPGGVGPMTVSMLLQNTLAAAEFSAAQCAEARAVSSMPAS